MGNVARRPDGRWRARYRGPDRKERAQHFKRKIDADRWLASVEVAKSRGEWTDPALSRITLGDWTREHWLPAQRVKASTRSRYDGIVEKYIATAWGRVPVGQVTSAGVAAWLTELSECGLSAASVRYMHGVLSRSLAFAVLDKRLARNPAAGLSLPRARSREKRFLSHVEVDRLVAECGEHGTLIYVLSYTGLRWGELAALRVSDVDLMRRRIDVSRAVTEVRGRAILGVPKDHETRSVVFPAFLDQPLAEHLAGRGQDELAFPAGAGTFLRNSNFRRRTFDPAAARAGLLGLTPHGLRHTAASLAIQSGATILMVQHMLGHSSATVTLDIYGHLYADDQDALAVRLDEARSLAVADRVRTDRPVTALPMITQGDQDVV